MMNKSSGIAPLTRYPSMKLEFIDFLSAFHEQRKYEPVGDLLDYILAYPMSNEVSA